MSKKIVVLLFIIIGLLQSCNTTEPPPPPPPDEKPTLTFTLEDASSIEVWIKLTTTNLQLPTTITLKQDNQTRSTVQLANADTLLYIDSLLPNTNYSFQVSSIEHQVSGNKLSVVTMDTTSHNFSWQSWTFGEHSNSVLFDVAIIDENNIWAVGEMFLNDSLGNPDPHIYNAVHWDGSEWNIKRIPFTGACSAVIYPPIRSIFTFSENDIWFARGGSLVHFDGNNYFNDCGMNSFLTGSINNIWGTSSSDLYIVGNNGNIAWYNGARWTRIESGTDVNLRDICGNEDEIWISGYSTDLSKSILLKLENNNVTTEWENSGIPGNPPYGNLIYSIYSSNKNLFIASNDGIFKSKLNIQFPTQKLFIAPRRVYKITGTGSNDLFTSGDRTNIWHYNGVTRKELYVNLSTPSPLYSAATKANIIAAVGTKVENVIYHQGIIIIGKGI